MSRCLSHWWLIVMNPVIGGRLHSCWNTSKSRDPFISLTVLYTKNTLNNKTRVGVILVSMLFIWKALSIVVWRQLPERDMNNFFCLPMQCSPSPYQWQAGCMSRVSWCPWWPCAARPCTTWRAPRHSRWRTTCYTHKLWTWTSSCEAYHTRLYS